MAMLMLASSTHSMPAAIHNVVECGMASSASEASTAPATKVRPAAPEPIPGAVGIVANDGLHDQPGQRRGDPQARDLVHLRAQGLEDAADVGVLQRESELDAEEPEAHVPDLPERHRRALRPWSVPRVLID